ncbi:hypothetical protein [Methylotuvimicrobium sp. KM1]|uniref:hypothetical protein n=1 Tax=Methylotuvimicrobium sp. KM1 TaxID=3377707 RepID=UPI003850DC18
MKNNFPGAMSFVAGSVTRSTGRREYFRVGLTAATDCQGWHECRFCITPWMVCIRAPTVGALGDAGAIAEEQKSALPPTPVNRATEPAYLALKIRKLFMTESLD